MLLRQEPALVTSLLEYAIGLSTPEGAVARLGDADFTQVVPLERRADAVVMLESSEGIAAAFVVEAQLGIDPEKRYTWPLYLASLHARVRGTSRLVVITPFEDVASWAGRPIDTMQPTSPLVPIVIGPRQIPRITEAAGALPELAMLSALVHGAEPDGAPVIEAALRAAACLDEERMRTYFDLAYATLGELAKVALEALMPLGSYEYKSDFAKKYLAQGREEGARQALIAVIAARNLELPERARRRVDACSSVVTLERWIRRAAIVERIDDVFADDV
ncbi:MAG: hypothetical protein KF795_05265 [Labilithrix sp.]|nr:hypothetical protein [Labilithrix sp.]